MAKTFCLFPSGNRTVHRLLAELYAHINTQNSYMFLLLANDVDNDMHATYIKQYISIGCGI